ncbi:MAG: vWA domain-containing protein [Oscillospiraceae bacterium]
MKKRIIALVLCAVMVLLLPATGAFAVDLGENQWQISKSKTATQLDANFESKVTLSLPSAEEQLVTDIVFVLDKSTSATLEQQALDMLTVLKEQAEYTGAKVKVGVVIFNKVANVTGFKDLATEYDAIEEAITQEIKSGTNTHAGLLAGKAMLDGDTSVDAARKYLIFVSDGITYMYDEDAKIVPYYWLNDNSPYYSSDPYSWQFQYGSNNPPSDWAALIGQIGETLEKETIIPILYDDKAQLTQETAVSVEDKDANEYTSSVGRALYYTHQTYAAAREAGYNCYAMTADTSSGSQYLWGPAFMNFLAGNREVKFSDIQNDILYLLGAGSTVEDVIGKATDNHGNPYDFKFVPEAGKISLTVGGKTYATVKADPVDGETARFLFTFDGVSAENEAEAPFELRYYENGTDANPEEHFVWYINVAVKNFEIVQLTYSVVLTNPQKTAGTYGEYDGNGSRGLDALYTNNRATLNPVASDGTEGKSEDFPKPTVSYTVGSSKPQDTVTIVVDGGEKEEQNPETGAPVFMLPGAVAAARAFL